jgi:hypothetical protein
MNVSNWLLTSTGCSSGTTLRGHQGRLGLPPQAAPAEGRPKAAADWPTKDITSENDRPTGEGGYASACVGAAVDPAQGPAEERPAPDDWQAGPVSARCDS